MISGIGQKEHLKEHGIVGLRVAEASIMPTIMNANTNAPSTYDR
jgi:choline dehydrogenase-like flavoprotein